MSNKISSGNDIWQYLSAVYFFASGYLFNLFWVVKSNAVQYHLNVKWCQFNLDHFLADVYKCRRTAVTNQTFTHLVKYAAKVFCDINHPATAVFEPHWTDRSRNYTANTVPISNKIAEFFRENNKLMWDCFILPLQPPWRRKEFPIDIHQ